MKLSSLLGWGIFLFCSLNFLAGYGARWQFGRYCMPSTILAPDGQHFGDGSEIDGITLAIKKSGHEEEWALALCGVIATAFGYLAHDVWQSNRVEHRRKEVTSQETVRATRGCYQPSGP